MLKNKNRFLLAILVLISLMLTSKVIYGEAGKFPEGISIRDEYIRELEDFKLSKSTIKVNNGEIEKVTVLVKEGEIEAKRELRLEEGVGELSLNQPIRKLEVTRKGKKEKLLIKEGELEKLTSTRPKSGIHYLNGSLALEGEKLTSTKWQLEDGKPLKSKSSSLEFKIGSLGSKSIIYREDQLAFAYEAVYKNGFKIYDLLDFELEEGLCPIYVVGDKLEFKLKNKEKLLKKFTAYLVGDKDQDLKLKDQVLVNQEIGKGATRDFAFDLNREVGEYYLVFVDQENPDKRYYYERPIKLIERPESPNISILDDVDIRGGRAGINIEDQPGFKYRMEDGVLYGENKELVKGYKIVRTIRPSIDFGQISLVEDGGFKLELPSIKEPITKLDRKLDFQVETRYESLGDKKEDCKIEYKEILSKKIYYRSKYRPEIENLTPKIILVDKDGSIAPDIDQCVIEGEDFLIYRTKTKDEKGNVVVKTYYPVITIVDRETGLEEIILNKNEDPLEMYIYKGDKVLNGELGANFGNKIYLKFPKGLKIDRDKINKDADFRIYNPIISEKGVGSGEDPFEGLYDKFGHGATKFQEQEIEALEIESLEPEVIVLSKGNRQIVIKGKNFGDSKNKPRVMFDGKDISEKIISWTNNEVVLELPEEEDGVYSILLTNMSNQTYDFINIEYTDEESSVEDFKYLILRDKPRDYGRNAKFLVGDFKLPNKNIEFKLESKKRITEKYFNENINSLKLKKLGSDLEIEVEKGPIYKDDKRSESTFRWKDGQVFIYLDEEALKKLSKGADFEECDNGETAAGHYEVYLKIEGVYKKFKIRIPKYHEDEKEVIEDSLFLKEKPRIIDSYPEDKHRDFNPNLLFESFEKEEGYYLRLKFNNLGNLNLVDGASPIGIRLNVKGDLENLVDNKKSLQFDKESGTLYIPLRDKLEDGKTYIGHLPENGYIWYEEFKDYRSETHEENNDFKNKCYRWEFGTNIAPIEQTVYEGAVVENYDPGYPMVIDGYNFKRDTMVRFISETGRYYMPDRLEIRTMDDGLKRLYIYLPANRLKVGEYSILLSNGKDHENEMEYGSFAVIKEGRYKIDDQVWTKYDSKFGRVYGLKGVSENELKVEKLKAKKLEIDLDEVFGIDTWGRTISYPEEFLGEKIHLVLKSKWADIEVYEFGPSNTIDDEMKLRVGRASPILVENVTKSLSKATKSDFIEVIGDNAYVGKLKIRIPFDNSMGEDIKMVKYDRVQRAFVDILDQYVNQVDRFIEANSEGSGIYVIVEKGQEDKHVKTDKGQGLPPLDYYLETDENKPNYIDYGQ